MSSLQTALLGVNTVAIAWLVLKNSPPSRASKHILVLDSCALIDGRILQLAQKNFIQDTFVIPHFVLRELQLLADGKDTHKRTRARYGLEVAEQLQALLPGKVRVDASIKSTDKTDELLLVLSRKLKARLCTTDYNLAKIAGVEGITALNLNDFALAMRTQSLPGEEKEIDIIQVGDNAKQGIGYLEDGSMVVVYGAERLVGTKQRIIIERSLQTVSGKMCFAHLKASDATAKRTVIRKK